MLDLFGPTVGAGGVIVRPTETRAFTATDTFFRDCSSPDLDDGTEFQAAWFNEMVGALRALVRGNGQTAGAVDVVTQDNADDNLLLKAVQHLIQRGQPLYGEDTSSTVNVMTAAISPAPAEYKKGMTVAIKANTSNTGVVMLYLNGLPGKNVVRPGGSNLLDGDITIGSVNTYRFDGTNWQLLGANSQPRLQRNATIYVNGAIGNDANDGTANIAGRALATLQAAINLAWGYTPSQYTITIQVAAGTYASCLTPIYPGPAILINGVSAGSVIVTSSGSTPNILVQGPNTMTVQNVTVQNTNTVSGAFQASYGGTLSTNNTISNGVGAFVFLASVSGNIILSGTHTFSGNCAACFGSIGGNFSFNGTPSFTFSAPMTVSVATVYCLSCGSVNVQPGTLITFNGGANVTGQKYSAITNGVINTNGGGINFFPGSLAGTSSTGGQYG